MEAYGNTHELYGNAHELYGNAYERRDYFHGGMGYPSSWGQHASTIMQSVMTAEERGYPMEKELFDYEAKYDAKMSDEIIPGRFSAEITGRIQDMASEVYDILRCEGIVRIDGFVRGEEIIMLEVNTTPGMTANSFVPKMVRVMGLPLRDVITGIIEEKLKRL